MDCLFESLINWILVLSILVTSRGSLYTRAILLPILQLSFTGSDLPTGRGGVRSMMPTTLCEYEMPDVQLMRSRKRYLPSPTELVFQSKPVWLGVEANCAAVRLATSTHALEPNLEYSSVSVLRLVKLYPLAITGIILLLPLLLSHPSSGLAITAWLHVGVKNPERETVLEIPPLQLSVATI